MASFRIHEDQENTTLLVRKDVEVFSNAQRRALGDLSHFACNQSRKAKLPNVTCKVVDENRTLRQIKNEKNIVPPVAQFRAFSVYEDKPSEVDIKKREPTFKPFVAKTTKENSFFLAAAENVRARCAKVDKTPESPKEAPKARLPLQEKKDVVESPMSVADSSILSMSISKNETTFDDVNDDDEEETIKAHSDRDMFFHVVEYQDDIYDYMREIEAKHRANPRYMRKQPDITHVMRSILVDWLVEVCDEYNQQNETLHLAVSYVDRFLSFMSVVRTKLQLVGTAATYIAAKYEEVYPPEVTEFVYITDDTYTKREVLRMEHLILKVLSFDLSTPTALAFLSHFCISNGYSKKILDMASYILELSLLEADPYLQFKPSAVAAGALATARHCLTCAGAEGAACGAACVRAAWPEALAAHTRLPLPDLEPVLRELARTHAHAHRQPYRAVPDKYKTTKFHSVSSLEPRPLYPVPEFQPAAAGAAGAGPAAADTTRSA